MFEIIDILLIEDNPADTGLFQIFFKNDRKVSRFQIAEDGEEALGILFHKEGFADSRRPQLIVLDINIPKIGGKDVLREIKTSPALCTIPVIVLTSSESEDDIRQSYERGANCVLIKPSDVDGVSDLFQSLEDFWINKVRYCAKTEGPGVAKPA